MANQILVDPFPGGRDVSASVETFSGSIALCGSAVATGEPINWASLVTGINYNEINRLGDGNHGSGNSLVTVLSGDGTTVTATAANNFLAGQLITFFACTSTLGLLLNGKTFQVVTASASGFTFLSAATGSGTGETGMAITANANIFPLQGANAAIAATVSALSASGTTLTVTAANTYLPGALVTVAVATGTLGPKLAGMQLQVLASTTSAFTARMPSALTGTTGVGTTSAINPPQPFSVKVWSELASGYVYQYSRTTGVLFVMQSPAVASTPATAAVLTALAAGAYPAGVLNDLVRFEAKFLKA